FNANGKGYAWMQPYIASTSVDPGQPFNLLAFLNTPLTVLSINTSIRSLPLAAMLTSDEAISTFSEALNRLKHILPITAFNNRGPTIGQKMVFAKTETKFDDGYKVLIMNQVYLKYSHFQKHFEAIWKWRKEWAIAKMNQDELLYSAEFATLNNNNLVDSAINEGCKNNFQNFNNKENILPESSAFVSVQSLINEVISEAESVYNKNSSDEESRGNDSIDGNTSNNEDEGLHQLTIDKL
ncbi:16203_t:CDS:2, partial [Gigaspora margarita]